MFHDLVMAVLLGGAISAGWAVLQVWILRSDPGRGEIRLGCGCGRDSCEALDQAENSVSSQPERFEV